MVLVPSVEEAVEINRKLGGTIVNRGILELILDKAKYVSRDPIKAAALVWYEIIQFHPFSDANKRTAFVVAKTVLDYNGIELGMTNGGKVYISLKIANNQSSIEEVEQWIRKNTKK